MKQDTLQRPDSEFLDDDIDYGMARGIDPSAPRNIAPVSIKEMRRQNKGSTSPTSVRLTEWAKEPSVQDLLADLSEAKSYRDEQVSRVGRWEELRNGGKEIKKQTGRSTVRPKLIRRQAEWRYSALSEPFLSSPDIFEVRPRTFEDGPAASQNAILINYQFNVKMDMVALVNEAVRVFVDEGTLILRPGWCRETGMVEEEVPIYEYTQVNKDTPEEAKLMEALQLRETNPRGYLELDPAIIASIDYSEENRTTAWATQVGSEATLVEKVTKNEPTLEVVDYRNMYVDPSCLGKIEDARFVIRSFETSKADLAKDGRYRNLNLVNYAAATTMGDVDHASDTPPEFNFTDEDRRRVVAYEYWGVSDIDGNGVLKPIVATWINNQLIRMEENPYPDKQHPFIFAPYSPKKRSVFGEPDAEILEDNQKISGALMRGLIDLLGRSANAQQGMAKGMLDSANKRRFQAGMDYEFNPNTNPNIGLVQHKYVELPASALQLLNSQNQEAEGLTGVRAFAGGMSSESLGDVAAGIRGTLDAASKREMDILRRLAAAFKKAAAKIIAMNAVFLSDKEVVRVTNDKFVPVKREDLAGNFDLVINISTPEVDERRANDLAFMLQTVGPNMPPQFQQMILAEIAELRKMPELANKITNFEPTPDPVAEAMQKLEIAEIEERISKIRSETARNYAQAEKFQSDADSIDLKTEMAGSGVAHAQDMEKQREQARGNQDLTITKALASTQKEGEQGPDIEAAVGFTELSKQLSDTGAPTPVF